jgi:hypothetical protein
MRATTRRGVLAAAAGAPLLLRVSAASAQAEDEDAALAGASLDAEQRLAVAYDAIAGSGVLGDATARVARRFGDQAQEHVDALAVALEGLDAPVPEPPAPRTIDGLDALIELEIAALAAHHDAVRRLRDAMLLETVATIMASAGQHLVVLRQMAGRDPLPTAFETGGP